jgi:hypothetical protein
VGSRRRRKRSRRSRRMRRIRRRSSGRWMDNKGYP